MVNPFFIWPVESTPGFKAKVKNLRVYLSMWHYFVAQKKPLFSEAFSVVPPGIEPGTQGFSVLCSTN